MLQPITRKLPAVPAPVVTVPRRGDRVRAKRVEPATAKLPAVAPFRSGCADVRLGVAGRLALLCVPSVARVGVVRVAVVSGLEVRSVVRLWWLVATSYRFHDEVIRSEGPGVAGLCLWVLGQVQFRCGAGRLVCPDCGRVVTVNSSGRFDAHAGVSGVGCGGSYDWMFPVVFASLGRRALVRRQSWWVRVRKAGRVAWLVVGRG